MFDALPRYSDTETARLLGVSESGECFCLAFISICGTATEPRYHDLSCKRALTEYTP